MVALTSQNGAAGVDAAAARRPARGQIVALDGLRGIAVLLVIVCHANLAFGGQFATGPLAGPLASLLSGGWIGVDLFFVLSGFLITGILFDSRSDPRYFRNFYARRALRIFPLYYLYVCGLLALTHVFPDMLGVPAPREGQALSLLGYYYNFYAALVPDGGARGFHFFWSLAVEEHFYLVWPLVVLRFSAPTIMRLCVLGMLASLALRIGVIASGAWLQVAYLITPCRLDGLLAGAFVALALRDPAWRERLRRFAPPVALVCSGLLAGLLLGQRHFSDKADLRYEPAAAVDSTMVLTVGLSALALVFAAVLFVVVERPASSPLRRALESGWLTAVGRYSYGMYIVHALLLRLVLYTAGAWDERALDLPDIVAKPVLALVVAGLSFVVARQIYDLFERRFLDMKKHFQPTDANPAVAASARVARAA